MYIYIHVYIFVYIESVPDSFFFVLGVAYTECYDTPRKQNPDSADTMPWDGAPEEVMVAGGMHSSK